MSQGDQARVAEGGAEGRPSSHELTGAERELQARVAAAERLTKLFQMERMTYLAFTGASVLVLLGSVVASLVKEGVGHAALAGMFGSSGVVTYSTGRVLSMWNKVVGAVYVSEEGKD